ncbi:unnamed protein product [Cylindrotheca closterium]|uniref:Uncharacterized protein n=1 Tax=Cylindrotheca closterium TaxID=2856 RepID=A0AAD2G8I0_9STRA|nr:unnamed protein product [Cylindrotheca closterium]
MRLLQSLLYQQRKALRIRSALLSTTSPGVLIPQHLFTLDENDLRFSLPRLGFVPRVLLGPVPITPTDVTRPAAARSLQALRDYCWARRLCSAQMIHDHGKPSSKSPPAPKEKPVKVNQYVPTESPLPATMYSDCDENMLSEYQCLVRQQLEFFESSKQDIRWSKQGRNNNLVPGQVGIRCKWCSHLPTQCRSPGAVYYSATLNGLYQAAQNMVKNHLCKEECRHVPPDIEHRLIRLRGSRRRGPGGKKYWVEGAMARGIYECGGRLGLKQLKVAIPCRKGAT